MSKPTHSRHLSESQQRHLLLQRRQTAAALLTAEGTLRGHLERALAFGVGYAHGSDLGMLRSAATGIGAAFAATILAGRRVARKAGRDRILDELGLSASAIELADQQAADKRRAKDTAAAFAGYWLASARKALADDATARQAIHAANTAQQFRVGMVATTEASTAFTAERSAVARAVVPLTRSLAVVPMKVWCSAREKNTCDRCYGEHGAIVRLDESFSLGEPGDVHPRCLCWFDVTWELASGGEAEAWQLEGQDSLALAS